MPTKNQVVWAEGLFIKPQHFQQNTRYLEHIIKEHANSVGAYLYGINELTVNTDYLRLGRFGLSSVGGIMPDGTVFNAPHQDILPDLIEIDNNSLVNQIVYLAIPLSTEANIDIEYEQNTNASNRLRQVAVEVRDMHTENGTFSHISVGAVRLRLMLEKDDRSAYATIPIARIDQKKADGSISLDSHFIPCHVNSVAVPLIYNFLSELEGLVAERARNISGRIGSVNQSGVADVSEFFFLNVLNRIQPWLRHKSQLEYIHPESLYSSLLSLCGELSTFSRSDRLPAKMEPYNHNDPTFCYDKITKYLMKLLSKEMHTRAISIPVTKRQYGLYTAPVADLNLIRKGDFILAVRANHPLDTLRSLFPQQIKIASIEEIQKYVNLQLPGIPLEPLPVVPRQLPYHSGFIYFQLDRSNQAWEMLQNSGGFAFHIAGEFSELKIEFWAIRG